MDMLIPLVRNNYFVTITPRYCGALMKYRYPGSLRSGFNGRDCRDGKLRHLPLVLWDIICCELGIGRWSSDTTSERQP